MSESFHFFLVVNFSRYLNRCAFVVNCCTTYQHAEKIRISDRAFSLADMDDDDDLILYISLKLSKSYRDNGNVTIKGAMQ